METQTNQSTFKSYLFFWSGQLVSLLGSSIVQFVLIWWITLETGSPFFLALAAFLGLVPMVILGPVTGVFADRVNRKVLIFTADFLQALATAVLIVLFWFGMASLWVVLGLLTVRGVFQAFHQPTTNAIIPSMVPADKLSRMNGLNYLFTGAMTLIGPVLAAVLLSFMLIYQVLWIDVATFAVAVVPLLLVRIPSVRSEQVVRDSSFKADFKEGFGFIRATRGFLPLLILATMLNFLLTPVSTLMPYFVKFDHLGGVEDLALIVASFQGGILAGGLLMTMIKGFKRKMVATAVAIYVVFLGYAVVALTPTGFFWFMAAGGVLMALCIPVANVSTQTIFQTVVPLKMQGRVNAVVMALASAATPAGMILSGVVVQFIQTANFFLICTVLGMLLLTLSWFFTDIKHVDKNTTNNNQAITQAP
jgi:DHA3 family macrolide efflux protein-like MFS transporter